MPAYAKDGNVVCFFQSAQKFKTRYATFGFSDKANRDEGAMWPTSFALTESAAAWLTSRWSPAMSSAAGSPPEDTREPETPLR
jgi:hypothetical protein